MQAVSTARQRNRGSAYSEVYIRPEEQDPKDLAWMREALVMVS
jgi:hypothetical protein